ncbi:hypothetical protein ACP4OV_010986 [Aristida adscensionis]
MSEGLVRRRPTSASPAPAPALEDEDLLWEILLRLSPLPSSLPRASLVSRRWRRVVSDPGFLRRFRAHHRTPPVLGLLGYLEGDFTPTLDAPDRIPAARFLHPPRPAHHNSLFSGCRHDLALRFSSRLEEFLVWNPVTGVQCGVPYPASIIKN